MNAAEWLRRGVEIDPNTNPVAAKTCFEQAMKLDPNFPNVVSHWLWGLFALCEWDRLDEAYELLRRDIDAGQYVFLHTVMNSPLGPAYQLKAAKAAIQARYPRKGTCSMFPPDRRIRVGYFGTDFYCHPTMNLMAGMFESHDRSKFEISIFTSSPNEDFMTYRARKAVEHFYCVAGLSPEEVVQRARTQKLDIAVDLQGYSAGDGFAPFALGLAPIQVAYLVYAGTTGADYMHYLIADPVLIPPELRQHYSEKIVYLPDCYQVNDRKRPLDMAPAGMKDKFGLPENGFIFASFNRSWKITPYIFDIWMRLLKAVPGSVLWLLTNNNQANQNLRKEAEARGVSGERLVFTENLPLPHHIARHRWADLLLDTPFYGAHTTASDALWAGLPVLTLQGDTFASRVASSLLHSVGLPELITTSPEAYEAKALELATNPHRLWGLQEHLVDNRLKFPAFDTVRTTRQIEAAYVEMYRRLAPVPEDITISG